MFLRSGLVTVHKPTGGTSIENGDKIHLGKNLVEHFSAHFGLHSGPHLGTHLRYLTPLTVLLDTDKTSVTGGWGIKTIHFLFHVF